MPPRRSSDKKNPRKFPGSASGLDDFRSLETFPDSPDSRPGRGPWRGGTASRPRIRGLPGLIKTAGYRSPKFRGCPGVLL